MSAAAIWLANFWSILLRNPSGRDEFTTFSSFRHLFCDYLELLTCGLNVVYSLTLIYGL